MRQHRLLLIAMGCLASCLVLVYWPALGGELLFDDVALLERQDCWRGLNQIPTIFGLAGDSACTYRPVRYLTFAIDYQVGGMDSTVFHVSNLMYHLITVLAVWLAYQRWERPGIALGLAALWALHPVHVDAVGYISGRRDIVSTLLFVLAFLQFTPGEGRRLSLRRVGLGSLLYALAFGAKEMAVTLPAVVVWASIVQLSGQPGRLKAYLRRWWWAYLGLFIAAAGFVWYRAVADSHSAVVGHWWGGDPLTNFLTVLTLYVRYLGLLIWPAELIGDYFPFTLPPASGLTDPMVLGGLALYLGLLGITVIALRRGARTVAFGIGWFLITMLPVSHIFPHHELFAEHYLYLPSIGLFVALAPLVRRALNASRAVRVAAAGAMVLVAAAYGVRTSDHAADFQTKLSFYENAHERAPNNARVMASLAMVYTRDGRCQESVPLLIEAAHRFEILQGALARGTFHALVVCAERLGHIERVYPVVDGILERFPDEPFALSWRARRQIEAGDLAGGEADLVRAIELVEGQEVDAVTLLGALYNRQGRHRDALDILERYPHPTQAHCEQTVRATMGLGVRYYSSAFGLAQSCLLLWPSSLELLEYRAGLYFSMGDRTSAEADVHRLEELGASEADLQRIRAWGNLRR